MDNSWSNIESLGRKATSIGTLSYNGRTGTCAGRDAADWYQITDRLVQNTYGFVLPYRTATWQDYSISTKLAAPEQLTLTSVHRL